VTSIEDYGYKPSFRVVTHKNWLADQFVPMGAVQDHGFDIDPATAQDTLWWAPGAWVASAFKAGVRLPLLSAGPYWLDRLPLEYKGREVGTGWVSDWPGFFERNPELVAKHPEIFVKLPEAKLDSFPARLHSTKHLRENLAQYHLPDDALVQIQEPVEFITEGRFWVAHGHVQAESLYRHRDWIWGSEQDPPFHLLVEMKLTKMRRFLIIMLDDTRVTIPPGVVIDIGITADGSPKVIEANAAWSSGPYDGNPWGIYKAIRASHDPGHLYPQWVWNPHQVFDKVQPLKTPTSQNPVERI
jgi:hypothetical protein